MLVGGVVVLLIAVGLVVAHVFARRKEGALLSAPPSTAAELLQIAKTVAGEIGGGGFKQFAEVSGAARCPRPLRSPLGEAVCLYYRMTITRRYEEEYWERDQQGNQVRRTRSGTEVMSTESNGTDFEVEDGTGSIQVRLDGADFDGLRKTVDRFEPGGDGMRVGFGRFSLSVSAPMGGRRTLGYEYDEVVLPAETRLTVIGEVDDGGGRLGVGRGGPMFIVSTRTKKEMVGSARKTAKITAVLSGICALTGIGLVIAGLLK